MKVLIFGATGMVGQESSANAVSIRKSKAW